MASTDLIVHDVYFLLHDRIAGGPAAAPRRLPPTPARPRRASSSSAAASSPSRSTRDVNDRDWDVGLHIVFRDLAAHDAYQDSGPHQQFIAENKATWKNVRVFDSVTTQSPTP